MAAVLPNLINALDAGSDNVFLLFYIFIDCYIMFLVVFSEKGDVVVEIWLTEPYYEEFIERKDVLFTPSEAIEVYAKTQELQKNWPGCISRPPPEVGARSKVFYMKFDWPTCRLRICFGARTENGVQKIVALTCRTKQEISRGSSNGTQEWYRHLSTVGVDRWDDYRRDLIKSWRIY